MGACRITQGGSSKQEKSYRVERRHSSLHEIHVLGLLAALLRSGIYKRYTNQICNNATN